MASYDLVYGLGTFYKLPFKIDVSMKEMSSWKLISEFKEYTMKAIAEFYNWPTLVSRNDNDEEVQWINGKSESNIFVSTVSAMGTIYVLPVNVLMKFDDLDKKYEYIFRAIAQYYKWEIYSV